MGFTGGDANHPRMLSKFLHANIYRFADHMKNDKCQQCIAWFWQTDKRLIIYRANYFGVFVRLDRKAFHFFGELPQDFRRDCIDRENLIRDVDLVKLLPGPG
jgi:hypothetical protein